MNRYKKSRFGAFGTFRSANPRPGYSAQGGFPVIVLLALCLSHHLFGQKKIEFADKTYEPQIKTVLLYSGLGNSRENLRPAVVPLQQQSLVLEFDDLQENSSDYYVKLIHCNYDWTKSTLMDLDQHTHTLCTLPFSSSTRKTTWELFISCLSGRSQ
jgi:hypothetical protein